MRGANQVLSKLVVTSGSTTETMEELIFLAEESKEGGYLAKALGHSIFTEGETIEEIKAAVKDVVRCHFDDNRREAIGLHFVPAHGAHG